MAIMAKEGGKSFEPVSEGVHTAVCVKIIDLGEQRSQLYDKVSRKVMLTWEVTDETIQIEGEDKPRVISKEYTLSLGEKAILRQHLEAWRNKRFSEQELKGFDLANVLGKACQLQVLHNEKGYANIKTIMAVPKGMPAIQPSGETLYFDLSDKGCLELLDKLPGWIQDKVKESSTYKELVAANVDTENGGFEEIDPDEGELPF